MSDMPKVACIMLVNGRHDMVQRAFASYRSQTYVEKELIILDTGDEDCAPTDGYWGDHDDVRHRWADLSLQSWSIGRLRNEANTSCKSDLIAHWDSDDWSHPRRLEEQVEFLMASGKRAVGYRDMLFWDTTAGGETWLYDSGHPMRFVGSSMLYTREAWERSPFHPDEPNEDQIWWMQNQSKCTAMRSMMVGGSEPAMICSIHGANTSEAYAREKRKMPHWLRLENWDAHCAKVMAL